MADDLYKFLIDQEQMKNMGGWQGYAADPGAAMGGENAGYYNGGDNGGGNAPAYEPPPPGPAPGSPNEKFPDLPPVPKNPWLEDMPRIVDDFNLPRLQESTTATRGGWLRLDNPYGKYTDAGTKDSVLEVKGADGSPYLLPRPPKNYEEAGDYQKFIDGWRDTIDKIRQSLGITGLWDQNAIDKLKPYFDQLGIKYQAKPGEKWSSRIYIPDGKGGYIQIDMRGPGGEYGWVNYGHTEQSGALTGQGGGQGGPPRLSGGGGGNLPAPGGGGGGNTTQNLWADRANSLYDTLAKRAGQSLLIDRNDAIIRNQSDAYAAMQERNRRNYLTEVAERAGPFANVSAERRSSAEKVGQATSAFEASLMGSELKARREEIAQALQGMYGLLSFEQELELRDRLGMLDIAIRQAALAEQGRQFDASLLQRAFEFDINDEFRRSPLGGGY